MISLLPRHVESLTQYESIVCSLFTGDSSCSSLTHYEYIVCSLLNGDSSCSSLTHCESSVCSLLTDDSQMLANSRKTYDRAALKTALVEQSVAQGTPMSYRNDDVMAVNMKRWSQWES
uniref:Uncharacterized protein n=1 Tax=Timema tahoe TaxID=61484 RepID=A0A7R9IJZ8_9NEOP|nr:unnamed protein product [Timema tahoe]